MLYVVCCCLGIGPSLLRHALSHRAEATLPVMFNTYAPRAVPFDQRHDCHVVSEREAGEKVWWFVHGHNKAITLPTKAPSTSPSWMSVLGIVASIVTSLVGVVYLG